MKDQTTAQNGSYLPSLNAELPSASPSEKSLWGYILSDLDRYRVTDGRSYIAMFVICPGVTAGIVYRIGHWLWSYKGFIFPVTRALYLLYIVVKRFSEIVTGIHIHPQATIGEGLYIGHGGSIHIGGKAVLGKNCNISHEVTIGVAGRGDRRGTPHIGDRIYIAPGAKLFGPIEIGHDVAIGANAVVTKSLPDRAVAVGIPAQIISYQGSFEFVIYRGKDDDKTRQQSLDLQKPLQNGLDST